MPIEILIPGSLNGNDSESEGPESEGCVSAKAAVATFAPTPRPGLSIGPAPRTVPVGTAFGDPRHRSRHTTQTFSTMPVLSAKASVVTPRRCSIVTYRFDKG